MPLEDTPSIGSTHHAQPLPEDVPPLPRGHRTPQNVAVLTQDFGMREILRKGVLSVSRNDMHKLIQLHFPKLLLQPNSDVLDALMEQLHIDLALYRPLATNREESLHEMIDKQHCDAVIIDSTSSVSRSMRRLLKEQHSRPNGIQVGMFNLVGDPPRWSKSVSQLSHRLADTEIFLRSLYTPERSSGEQKDYLSSLEKHAEIVLPGIYRIVEEKRRKMLEDHGFLREKSNPPAWDPMAHTKFPRITEMHGN